MVVVDSSGWMEHFRGGPRAGEFAPYLLGKEEVAVPTIVIFEVYRKIKKVSSEEDAIFAVTQMRRCSVTDLDDDLALQAADLSLKYRLAMADAIVYATAIFLEARLVTSDNDLRNLPGVVFI